MKTLLPLFLLFWSIAQIPVQADDNDDRFKVVIGKRVGEIKPGMNLEDVIHVYGKAVEPAPIPGPEGSTFDGAYVFRGTDRELQIIWDPESRDRIVAHIRIIGKEWDFNNDLKLGKSLKDVEEINGRPFKVWGFEWDLGGFADFEGGRLAGVVGIRFSPSKPQKMSEAIIGDQQIPSDHPALREVKPEVSEITVNFPVAPRPPLPGEPYSEGLEGPPPAERLPNPR